MRTAGGRIGLTSEVGGCARLNRRTDVRGHGLERFLRTLPRSSGKRRTLCRQVWKPAPRAACRSLPQQVRKPVPRRLASAIRMKSALKGDRMSQRYEREQAEAIRAVRLAAQLCRTVAAGIRPEVMDKKDKSPVTVADFGSQAVICHALAEVFPDDPIIAEEDSAELRQAENAEILQRVFEQVEALDLGAAPSPAALCRSDRSGRGQPLSRPVLDARPDRRHQGIPPRRAVRRGPGAHRRRPGRGRGPGVPELADHGRCGARGPRRHLHGRARRGGICPAAGSRRG